MNLSDLLQAGVGAMGMPNSDLGSNYIGISDLRGLAQYQNQRHAVEMMMQYGVAIHRPGEYFISGGNPTRADETRNLRNAAGETPRQWADRVQAWIDDLDARCVAPWPCETLMVEAEIAEWEAIRDRAVSKDKPVEVVA